MQDKKSFAQRAERFLNGKGFYIVLFVCVAVIGVSAWLLMFSELSPLADVDDAGDYVPTMGDAEIPEAQDPVRTVPAPSVGDEIKPEKPNIPPKTDKPSVAEDKQETLTVTDGPDEKPSEKPGEKKTEPSKPKETPESKPAAPASTVTPKDLSFIWPVAGKIAVPYSPAALIYDRTMGDWRAHDGVDIAAPVGTRVLAACDGVVKEVRSDDMLGTVVVIEHGAGVVTTCANLNAVPTVNAGDAVTMGSVIGAVGTTSLAETGEVAHLHFTMTVDGESADPSSYLPRR